MQNSYVAAIRKIVQLWRRDGQKRIFSSAHGLPERIPKNDTGLQNPDGDQIRAEAEFNMMENINLLIIEHCNLACAHCSTGAPFARKMYHPAESFCKWLDLLETKEIPFKYIALTGGEPFLHPEVRDGSFIRLLRTRYPSKRVGLYTNFFWASKERIIKYAPIIGMMNGSVGISVYEPIVKKLGGLEEFHRLAKSLKDACPNTWIHVEDRPQFAAWKFHEDEREVKGPCMTSDCFVLKPDGKLSHCSLGIGAQNIPEYDSILKRSKEAILDLSKVDGKEEFLSWSQKYPFDLCLNCTMWEPKIEPWHSLR
jgi:4Fe-4S single cluster domain